MRGLEEKTKRTSGYLFSALRAKGPYLGKERRPLRVITNGGGGSGLPVFGANRDSPLRSLLQLLPALAGGVTAGQCAEREQRVG